MTRKEAIEKLKLLDSLTDNEKFSEAFVVLFEAAQPWKKLSEETPTKEDYYLIYKPREKGSSRFEIDYYGPDYDGIWGFDNEESITHWCELVGPEDE